MTTTQMVRDLAVQAENYLTESLDEVIPETTRDRLVTWICSKIEEERQGWKKKIKMSFDEVEKERKLAMSTHTAVQGLNDRFSDCQGILSMFSSDMDVSYENTDIDSRISNLELLDRNIDMLLQAANQMYQERLECFQNLNVADDNCHLADVIKHKISVLEDGIASSSLDNKDTENRLLREIKNLNETLDMQINLNKEQVKLNEEQTALYEDQIAEMKRVILSLRNKVPGRIVASVVPGNIRTLLPVSFDKSCQTDKQAAPPTRDCCIQVHLVQYSDISDNNGDNWPKLERESAIFNVSKSRESINQSSDLSQHTINQTDSKLTRSSSVLCVNSDINKNGKSEHIGKHDKLGKVEKTKRIKLKKLLNTDIVDRTEYIRDDSHKENIESVNEIKAEYLRGQVVSLARKLDTAKVQMDVYQQQLAFMRLNANQNSSSRQDQSGPHRHTPQPPKPGIYSDTPRSMYSSQSVYDFRGSDDNGFLSGVKVKEVKMSPGHKSEDKASVRRPSKSLLQYNGTAKCLRCNSLYRLKENHPSACRFHPKGKHRVEKYDPSERLQKVFYLWECCMQDTEVKGCRAGEHI